MFPARDIAASMYLLFETPLFSALMVAWRSKSPSRRNHRRDRRRGGPRRAWNVSELAHVPGSLNFLNGGVYESTHYGGSTVGDDVNSLPMLERNRTGPRLRKLFHPTNSLFRTCFIRCLFLNRPLPISIRASNWLLVMLFLGLASSWGVAHPYMAISISPGGRR
ncbi:hypothetical protein F4809DRAFT_607205 [Biscogniauxia mediterranea]|nr:hypothetical protein F4809DRAFT_607205 [Biscogniauxia mediterranea]